MTQREYDQWVSDVLQGIHICKKEIARVRETLERDPGADNLRVSMGNLLLALDRDQARLAHLESTRPSSWASVDSLS